MPLLLLSKSNPLRWASIWVFFFLFAVSFLCRRRHYVGVIFYIACSDLFYKSERAHAAAGPQRLF